MWFSQVQRLAGIACLVLPALFQAGCVSQREFSDPDQAVAVLVRSMQARNHQELHQILGSDGDDLIFSGDPTADEASVTKFLTAYGEKHRFEQTSSHSVQLLVGNDEWPLPIPILKNDFDKRWYFDTEGGKDEIINRRVGRNELNTIQTCLAIADAEREYADTDPEHLGMPVYAQKILSDPGRRNGLYWGSKEGEKPSPLGELVATAEGEGYSVSKNAQGPQPYHGYLYRILKAQGTHAAGGTRDYMVGDKMLGGFAVIAVPASYGSSGVMTFIMNQDGIVYQADLGDFTPGRAARIQEFDPDFRWEKVKESDAAVPPSPASEPAK